MGPGRVVVAWVPAVTMTRSSVRTMLPLVLGLAAFLVGTPGAWAAPPGHPPTAEAGHHPQPDHHPRGKSSKPKAHKPHGGPSLAKKPNVHGGHGKNPSPDPHRPTPQPAASRPPTTTLENGAAAVSFTVQRVRSGAPRAAGLPAVVLGLANLPDAPPQPAVSHDGINGAANEGSVLLAGSDAPLGTDAAVIVAGLAMIGLTVFLVARRGRLQLVRLTARSRGRR
jgi:hypothetical protein